MPKSRRRTPGKPGENHVFSLFFQGLVGQNPFQNLRKTRPIILNRSQPPPTLPDPFYIDFTSLIIFFLEKMYLFLSISYIFIIFSAPEAPGPVPNCRSHFSAQTRVIESFWNPQGTSFVTKQCPKCIAKKNMQNLERTTNQLVGCSQATNQLAGGFQASNQPVGGLQTANQLGKVGSECFGTLFCHEWGVLEDSEALVDTIQIRKMRSTIWEWSQSLQGSGNNKKKEIL